ncbi:dihydropteroate synthase [Flavobacteriaceae bacterium 3-367]|uniref:dihydropteroate synthase n=1 Tax=Eudoraea algarum TaxID=3417568 RepID=UPI00326992E5
MTINCKGNLIDLKTPKVMGILNLTPDSFFDGGKYRDTTTILGQVEKMVREGADFIDLGAYSSRPGAAHVPEETELERIVPVVTLLQKEFPELLLSIDTFRSKVAAACLEKGAALINDISAGSLDTEMFPTVAVYRAPYIMMHMKGTPQNMQQQTNYTDLLVEICHYFSQKIALATTAGVNDIILDPGFGFAKTLDQNYELLRKLALLQTFDLPILAGLSRKSMIYRLLETDPQQALNGTTALHMYALQQGAHILRVHDVREAKECVLLAEELKQGNC